MRDKSHPVFGELPENWEVSSFIDVLDETTRNGIYKPKRFHGSGIKMVNMGELFAYDRIGNQDMRRVELSNDEINRFSLKKGDLLFARRSLVASGAGKCSLVEDMDEITAFESSIIRARPNQTIVDSKFLFYLFLSIYGKYLMQSILRQVAVSGITGTDLMQLDVPLPPLPEQRRIAHILGTLDDKIELNRRTNQTLEAIARAIFKSWFVNFDPVRAKIDGRPTGLPSGLPPHIADLFPDSFEDSELGKIPSGWRVGNLTEILDILSGGTPSTKVDEYWDGGLIEWVSARDVGNNVFRFVLDTERKITEEGLENSSAKLLPKKTTIITARGTVGNICLLGKTMSMNQTNYGLKAIEGIGDYFVFFTIANAIGLLQQRSYGTIFDTITTKTLLNILIAIPPQEVIQLFEESVAQQLDKILSNQKESQTLADIRDTLLPRMMRGELRL